MIVTEALFAGIKDRIHAEITAARRSIFVAVAWFTDRDLFAALVERQRAGVAVSLAVVQDSINAAMPFEQLAAEGGTFFRLDGALMHNKFCILDGRDVITGSYNWTYKAAQENFENIVVTSGDYDLAFRFIAEFKRITGHADAPTAAQVDLAKVVRRLKAISSLIQLEEEEDILRQARRLQAEWPDELANTVAQHLEARQYVQASREIQTFLDAHARVTV
ncbi:phospholipase D-like domain-containing protein [Hymenobacter weizhouensis]|uniref:phospholipase D-like domain-containing protein n=1 Tax=Hymenobacter sp. YIM 151500-1 TaxID=2987689 RepID=UPI002225DB18|nr:phospholipase D-like domain-containing protein [Hymenobacter sp. YIM 151500-1]UYZ64196.1 phospholipase D-like domain-containing protein [Hymenobacter sp. YIM 151500-1]